MTSKALSIKQPWANLIAQGYKTLEIRSWKTHYRGDIVICSSLNAASDYIKKMRLTSERGQFCKGCIPELSDFYHFGKTICVAELYDIVQFTRDMEDAAWCEYSPDLYAWKLRNIRILSPTSVKGKLGLFNIDIR